MRLLQKAAVVCGEHELGFIRGKRGPSADSGAPGAMKETDIGTARDKVAAGSGPDESAACSERRDAEVNLWADNSATAAWNKIAAHRRRKSKGCLGGPLCQGRARVHGFRRGRVPCVVAGELNLRFPCAVRCLNRFSF